MTVPTILIGCTWKFINYITIRNTSFSIHFCTLNFFLIIVWRLILWCYTPTFCMVYRKYRFLWIIIFDKDYFVSFLLKNFYLSLSYSIRCLSSSDYVDINLRCFPSSLVFSKLLYYRLLMSLNYFWHLGVQVSSSYLVCTFFILWLLWFHVTLVFRVVVIIFLLKFFGGFFFLCNVYVWLDIILLVSPPSTKEWSSLRLLVRKFVVKGSWLYFYWRFNIRYGSFL